MDPFSATTTTATAATVAALLEQATGLSEAYAISLSAGLSATFLLLSAVMWKRWHFTQWLRGTSVDAIVPSSALVFLVAGIVLGVVAAGATAGAAGVTGGLSAVAAALYQQRARLWAMIVDIKREADD